MFYLECLIGFWIYLRMWVLSRSIRCSCIYFTKRWHRPTANTKHISGDETMFSSSISSGSFLFHILVGDHHLIIKETSSTSYADGLIPFFASECVLLLWIKYHSKLNFKNIFLHTHCVKSVQIQSFFWFVFSRIRTEYGEIRSISIYSVRVRESTDQNLLLSSVIFYSCVA